MSHGKHLLASQLDGLPIKRRRNLQHRVFLWRGGIVSQSDGSADRQSMLCRVELKVEVVIAEGEGFAVKTKSRTTENTEDTEGNFQVMCRSASRWPPATTHWSSFSGAGSRTSPRRQQQKHSMKARHPAWEWRPRNRIYGGQGRAGHVLRRPAPARNPCCSRASRNSAVRAHLGRPSKYFWTSNPPRHG